jgi:hypothetical protein
MARFAGRGAVHRRSLSISHWGSKFQLEIPLQLRLPLNGKQARLEDEILVCHRRERREIAVQADLASLGQRHFLFSRLPRSLVFFLGPLSDPPLQVPSTWSCHGYLEAPALPRLAPWRFWPPRSPS